MMTATWFNLNFEKWWGGKGEGTGPKTMFSWGMTPFDYEAIFMVLDFLSFYKKHSTCFSPF